VPRVFAVPYQALMPVFQKDVLGVGPGGLGLLMAAPGAGPLPVVITRTRPDALRLRGVRRDQVRIAGPRTESGPP